MDASISFIVGTVLGLTIGRWEVYRHRMSERRLAYQLRDHLEYMEGARENGDPTEQGETGESRY